MSTPQLADAVTCTAEQVTGALLEVAQITCWADGSPLVDLDDAVIRDRLAPNLLAVSRPTAHCARCTNYMGPPPSADPDSTGLGLK